MLVARLRRPRRALAAVGLMVGSLGVLADPVSAATTPPLGPPTAVRAPMAAGALPASVVTETPAPGGPAATRVTVPADGRGTPGPTSPAGADPSTTSSTTPPDDPLVDEAAGEEAPETGATVPPRGGYGGQSEFRPATVLWSNVRQAEAKLAAAVEHRDGLVDRLRQTRLGHKRLRLRRDQLDAEDQRAVAELAAAERRLQDRAVAAFVANDSLETAALSSLESINHDRILEFVSRRRLLDVALDADDVAITAYFTLRDRLDDQALSVADSISYSERTMAALEPEAEAAAVAVDRANDELEAFRAGSSIYIDNVVFPVVGPDLPLIDSWGFPRMPGTPDEHWHEGIDVFAPAGTPLVAAERGVVTRVGSGRLGGLTVWLRGESGADWYYAHLSAHAPGLAPGDVVEAGDPLGWVGNTGNAASTPAHLHLQLHPDGGDPINPYPLLNVIALRDQEAQHRP
ncbi:MAG: peptidoglycan DD-metalloendopeptidase family protein [Acidimicrobiales bacterium]